MSLSGKNKPGQKEPIVFVNESEDERLLRHMNRSDMEKFTLFMQMLRRNSVLKKAKITHK